MRDVTVQYNKNLFVHASAEHVATHELQLSVTENKVEASATMGPAAVDVGTTRLDEGNFEDCLPPTKQLTIRLATPFKVTAEVMVENKADIGFTLDRTGGGGKAGIRDVTVEEKPAAEAPVPSSARPASYHKKKG